MGDKFSKSGINKEIPTFAMIGPQKSGKFSKWVQILNSKFIINSLHNLQ